MTMTDIPLAMHRGPDELPFVDIGDGSRIQLLQVDIDTGLWVIRTRFSPGYEVQTHKHTGEVFAFTLSGANLNLDPDGNVTSVLDATLVRDGYLLLAEAAGVPNPPVIGL